MHFTMHQKGCIKQDDGCCKGQRPQTVCHHHQAPQNLLVASLSTLPSRQCLTHCKRAVFSRKTAALNKIHNQAREKGKSDCQLLQSPFKFPRVMTPKCIPLFLIQLLPKQLKGIQKQQEKSYTFKRSMLPALAGLPQSKGVSLESCYLPKGHVKTGGGQQG